MLTDCLFVCWFFSFRVSPFVWPSSISDPFKPPSFGAWFWDVGCAVQRSHVREWWRCRKRLHTWLRDALLDLCLEGKPWKPSIPVTCLSNALAMCFSENKLCHRKVLYSSTSLKVMACEYRRLSSLPAARDLASMHTRRAFYIGRNFEDARDRKTRERWLSLSRARPVISPYK